MQGEASVEQKSGIWNFLVWFNALGMAGVFLSVCDDTHLMAAGFLVSRASVINRSLVFTVEA